MLLTLKPCPSRICVSFSSSFQRFSLNVFLVLRPQLLVKAFFLLFSAHFLFFQRGVRRLIYSTHREPRSGPRRNLEKLESCRCVCCAVLFCAPPPSVHSLGEDTPCSNILFFFSKEKFNSKLAHWKTGRFKLNRRIRRVASLVEGETSDKDDP